MTVLAHGRLVVPVSLADKQSVERKASAGHMSMAEFARRALLRDDPGEDDNVIEAELRALLDVFHVSHQQTLDQLERTDRALDTALAYFDFKQAR
jgi:hypothetical protein